MDNSDAHRDAVHEALQANPAPGNEGRVLTGWIIVSEWMDPDGERWLGRMHSATTPAWTAKGFLHEGLYGEWPDPDDED